jgi:flagellar L-ring protein precursor FlgH
MKRIGTWIAIIALAALAVGCAGPQPAQQPVSQTPANQDSSLMSPPVQQYPPPAPKTEGSLYDDARGFNLFTDNRASRVGDIITINVVETSSADKSAQTDLSRDSTIGAGLTSLLGYETSLGLNGDFAPETALDLEFENEYKGKGTTKRSDNLVAQMSARVIQVLPNDYLVIRGSREITVNREKQYIVLQGVVRPEDISANNTVESTYIADARIDYLGKGDIQRQQRQGWGGRLLDVVWPF